MVTGGARGLGLTLAEALVEAGGHGTRDDTDAEMIKTNNVQYIASTDLRNHHRNSTMQNKAARTKNSTAAIITDE